MAQPNEENNQDDQPATPAQPGRQLSAALCLEAGSDQVPTIAHSGGSPEEIADMLDRAAEHLRGNDVTETPSPQQ